MSQENVEIVEGSMPDPDVDLAALVRDDDQWAATAAAVATIAHPDFEFVLRSPPRDETPYPGVEGLRTGLIEWFGPWASYRLETERAIDLGERVLLLNVEYGRIEASTPEVKVVSASVWTFRDRRIIRMETYPREDALKAVGLEE